MSLTLLPNENIFEIGLNLPLYTITRLCQTNVQFNEVICNDEYFWEQKFLKDYKFIPEAYTGSWRHLYQNYMNSFVFGSNKNYALGVDPDYFAKRYVPTQLDDLKFKQIVAGRDTTMGIDFENYVWVWGWNDFGTLGIGDNRTRTKPTKTNFKAKQIATKETRTIAIDLDNNVWYSGDIFESWQNRALENYQPEINTFTQLEGHTAKQVSTNGTTMALIDLDDRVYMFDLDHIFGNIYGRHARYVWDIVGILKAKHVSIGYKHILIVDLDDNLWVWGDNTYGQIGLVDSKFAERPIKIPNFKIQSVSAGSNYSMFIDSLNNNVWVSGSNIHGQLGLSENVKSVNTFRLVPRLRAKMISASTAHSAIIDLENNVWISGYNSSGELGLGDTKSRYRFTQIPNMKAREISVGHNHTVLIGTRII